MNEVNSLVKKFVNEIMKYEEAAELNDSVSMNKQHEEIRKIMMNLKAAGKEVEDKMIQLLYHESNYVKCNAAYYLIPAQPEKARKTLEEIASLRGLKAGTIAFTAKMTLREWDNGNLKFD